MKLGICGSGQLSMMLCEASKKLNIKTIVLSDSEYGSAKKYCDEYFFCNYNDEAKLKEFAEKIDVATLEFENIDFKVLKKIEKFVPLYPKPEINRIVQNRELEKNFFKTLKIPTTEFAIINNMNDIKNNLNLLPGILKSITGGYDGHFSYKINEFKDLKKNIIDFNKKFILEKKVNILKEISIIGTRYQSGEINFFQPFENIHKDQILRETIAPADLSDKILNQAQEYTKKILEKHNYIGTMTVEFFIDKSMSLLANETASRVHNSGHITINNSNSSQFNQHVRAVCNLEPEKISLMKKGKMINILGDDIEVYRKKKFKDNEYFYDYEKKEIRPKRKMGHLNIIEQ